jgi:hypothetical protein
MENREAFVNFGTGDIIVDNAADEICWPKGQGDVYPTTTRWNKLRLRTANGGEL